MEGPGSAGAGFGEGGVVAAEEVTGGFGEGFRTGVGNGVGPREAEIVVRGSRGNGVDEPAGGAGYAHVAVVAPEQDTGQGAPARVAGFHIGYEIAQGIDHEPVAVGIVVHGLHHVGVSANHYFHAEAVGEIFRKRFLRGVGE